MSKSKKRKHSKSRSRNGDNKVTDRKLQKMQDQLNVFTKVITTLVKAQEAQTASSATNRQTYPKINT